jgi:hypothetical protein
MTKRRSERRERARKRAITIGTAHALDVRENELKKNWI